MSHLTKVCPKLEAAAGLEEEAQFCNCTEEEGARCCACSDSWEEMKIGSQEQKYPVDECMILLWYGPDGEQHEDGPHCCTIDSEEGSSEQPMSFDGKGKRQKKKKKPTAPPRARSHELEAIIAERKDPEGNPEFLCIWKGWSEAHNSWIAETKLSQAKRLVSEWRDRNPIGAEEGRKKVGPVARTPAKT